MFSFYKHHAKIIMKILIIANSNNFWVHAFLMNVINLDDEIYLLNSDVLKDEYKKDYQERKVILIGTNKQVYKIPKIGTALKKNDICKEICKVKHFERCIILNTTDYRLSIWNSVKHIIDRTAVLYWGSDIHRVPQNKLQSQKKYLDYIDDIVFTAKNLKIAFEKVFSEKYSSKSHIIQFGLDSLNFIDDICKKYSREQVKEELGLPPNKVTISIGYCGIPEQQHEKIINEILKLDNEQKAKFCIMLQFMYNTDSLYRKHIIGILKKADIDYKVFDKFLLPPELAKLRYSTDIFINAQTTDALSGSVLESLYAGAKLISAEWLVYPEFEDLGIEYCIFAKFDEIGENLTDVISSQRYSSNLGNQKLKSLVSWTTCRNKWQFFF